MIDFSDLDDKDLNAGGVRKTKKDRPTFPCQSCAGTGKYRGVRVHQPEERCFSCGGKGFFYTSPFERQKKRDAKMKRRSDAIIRAHEAFNEQYPGVIEMAREFAKTSDFMRDLVQQYASGKLLSERQVESIRKFAAKREEWRINKEAERKELSAVVDLSPIHAMFESARKAGLKRLAYRAEGLLIKPAGALSANAGALYVKTENDLYLGKVVGNEFKPSRDAKPEHRDALKTIAVNPIEAAKAYGKLVGRCSCCGRALTDPQSIELGIGPVCADKWFGVAMPGLTKAEVKQALKEAEVDINTNYGKASSQTPVAGKYDHLYTPGMSAKEKQRIRAQARKEARK